MTTNINERECHIDRPQVWNPQEAVKRLGGDVSLLDELVRIFLDDAPRELTILQRAEEDRDITAIEAAAHKLRGELAYLGLSRLSTQARELEETARGNKLEYPSNLVRAFLNELREVLDAIRESHDDIHGLQRGA